MLTQIPGAFHQIVRTSLAPEVQQIGNHSHRPQGCELSGGLAMRDGARVRDGFF